MRHCPPNQSCSRHLDGPVDAPGQTRTAQAKSGGHHGKDRTPPDTTSRQNPAAGTPFGGPSGDASPDHRGIPVARCAIIHDRDNGQAAHRTQDEHQLPAHPPSHQHHPRDSIENTDSHRQNAGVESGVMTRRHACCARKRKTLTPWLHDANPPYAYRTKSMGGRDVLAVGFTQLGLLGTSASTPRTKTPYTRRAEKPAGRALRGPRRQHPMHPANPVEVQP